MLPASEFRSPVFIRRDNPPSHSESTVLAKPESVFPRVIKTTAQSDLYWLNDAVLQKNSMLYLNRRGGFETDLSWT